MYFDIAVKYNKILLLQAIFTTANLFEMLHICEICAGHMVEQLHISNCVAVYQFGSFHNWTDLKSKAKDFVLDHFSEVIKQEEMMLLGFDDLAELIADDNLNVKKEETVYKVVVRWVEYDLDQRLNLLYKLLQLIRLSLISDQFIGDHIGKFIKIWKIQPNTLCPINRCFTHQKHYERYLHYFAANPLFLQEILHFNIEVCTHVSL